MFDKGPVGHEPLTHRIAVCCVAGFLITPSAGLSNEGSIDPAETCATFHHTEDFRTRRMFTGWDVSVDVPAHETDFITVRYDRAYEAGPNIAGGSFGGKQRDHLASFELNIADGSPFLQGAPNLSDDVPVTERLSFRILLSSRGQFATSREHLPTQVGRPVANSLTAEGYEVIGQPFSFHGLTQITFPDRLAYHSERHDIFIEGVDPTETEYFLVCGKVGSFPNPGCNAYLDVGVFDVNLHFRRALMDEWPQIKKQAERFVGCMID
jgi:hypothetical protein